MNSILRPKLGFGRRENDGTQPIDAKTSSKIARSGVEAARRKFTPEFMNRLDKIVVFQPLGSPELRRILDLELSFVQQRIFQSGNSDRAFVLQVSDSAKEKLLKEGTDAKYGARHLKRAIERLLVQPLANLIATGQARGGDVLRVNFEQGAAALSFTRDGEGLPARALAELAGVGSLAALGQFARSGGEPLRSQSARSSSRRG
jgi:ATP-dependent Clp protease ATP-binding subunit ClpA